MTKKAIGHSKKPSYLKNIPPPDSCVYFDIGTKTGVTVKIGNSLTFFHIDMTKVDVEERPCYLEESLTPIFESFPLTHYAYERAVGQRGYAVIRYSEYEAVIKVKNKQYNHSLAFTCSPKRVKSLLTGNANADKKEVAEKAILWAIDKGFKLENIEVMQDYEQRRFKEGWFKLKDSDIYDSLALLVAHHKANP